MYFLVMFAFFFIFGVSFLSEDLSNLLLAEEVDILEKKKKAKIDWTEQAGPEKQMYVLYLKSKGNLDLK